MAMSIYHPSEQAPPVIVALNEYLVAIYRLIRDKYQARIDETFDAIARQVGFVVTTTVPVDLEVGKDGRITSVKIGAGNLQGTLFEKIGSVLSTQEPVPAKVGAGTYRIYLIWYPALRLKLRTDFMEPAHFTAWKEPAHPGTRFLGSLEAEISSRYVGRVPFHGEPVHWFDPGYVIAAEEAILIDAIDEVYPELHLADRITASRQFARLRVRPEIPEPAHFRQLDKALESEQGKTIAAEISAILRRYGY